MTATGMVGHNLQKFFLCFGTNHEIAIGPSISAINLSICFSGHLNTLLSPDQNSPLFLTGNRKIRPLLY
jgi:hypothetical protein